MKMAGSDPGHFHARILAQLARAYAHKSDSVRKARHVRPEKAAQTIRTSPGVSAKGRSGRTVPP